MRTQATAIIVAFALSISPIAGARTQRDHRAIAEFKRLQPCPANGNTYGSCPGYDIDHRMPLKCGGDDSPTNMQWLTKDEHKAKTAREAKQCRH